MANSLSLFLVFIATVLFIFQPVRLRYLYTSESILDFDLVFFRVILYPERNQKEKKRKSISIQNIRKKAANIISLKKAFDYTLKYCELTVNNIDVSVYQKTPDKAFVNAQNLSSLICYLLTYLKTKTRTFATRDFDFTYPHHIKGYQKILCDITLEFRLFHIYGFSFVYFWNFLKKKGKVNR